MPEATRNPARGKCTTTSPAIGIAPANRDVLGREGDDFTAHADLAVVVGHHLDLVARLAAVGVMGVGQFGGLRRRARADLKCRRCRDFSGGAVPDRAHPRFPRPDGRKLGEHVVETGKIAAGVPDVHVGVDIAQADVLAAHPASAVAKLSFDPLHVSAKLVAHLRDRGRHGGDVEFGAAQFLAVGDELLRDLVGERAEDEIDAALKERLVRPHRGGGGEALVSVRKQRRLRKTPLQFADDALGVAIDIGADLHHRGAAVASGHRHQVGPRHDSRNQHRGPRHVLQAEDQADLFRERRLREMMQDDGMCAGHFVLSTQVLAATSAS